MNRLLAATLLAAAGLLSAAAAAHAQVKLLNVSYDPTRELYQDFNAAFAKSWMARTKQTVTIQQGWTPIGGGLAMVGAAVATQSRGGVVVCR